MIRRIKADVLPELPPKMRQRVPVEVGVKDLKKLTSLMTDITASAQASQLHAQDGDGKRPSTAALTPSLASGLRA
jgi:hypothetical protein